jgi:hypothetical protein
VADPTDNALRIATTRDHLSAKLGELRRREAHVREVLSPVRYLASPWLRVGIAMIVGYRLGRPDPVRPAVAVAPPRETVIQAIVRASVVAIAQAVVRRAMVRIADEL